MDHGVTSLYGKGHGPFIGHVPRDLGHFELIQGLVARPGKTDGLVSL